MATRSSPRGPVARYECAARGPVRVNGRPDIAPCRLNARNPDHATDRGDRDLPTLARTLQEADAALRRQFLSGTAVQQLVRDRAQTVDGLIRHVYRLNLSQFQWGLSLAAVGGYGRGELHPYSDVDLLIMLSEGDREPYRHAIEHFVAFLWDMGLQANHSVRTLQECIVEAQADVTVATNLMESRHLAGDAALFVRLRERMMPDHLWSAKQFFIAKRHEQEVRHAKYHDNAYRLEPNIKECSGGLRDIQMIGWVAKRRFGADTLHSLVDHHFLLEEEYQALCHGQDFLWRIRFALHVLHGRREDRLLFDAQPQLARQFGYRDAPQALAVEQFMQDYYRTINQLGLLNEMLLQVLDEAILTPELPPATRITEEFEERGGFLHANDPGVFSRQPRALLEVFLVLAQHLRLKGLGASTLRRLCANLERIDATFRADPLNHILFMQILRSPGGVTQALRRMSRYGVLGRYLPAFGDVVGRMQYDLFHAYTVDEHILRVVSNLRRFALVRYDHEFPLCSQIMQTLPKPELAYLGALFHDIAKGRGGNHSEIGAQDAEAFCLLHGLNRYDAHLVAWLVQHHLLLSVTAQKKDIHDLEVIHALARQLGDQAHLDYLYVLTVADVCGTSPNLWNAWKASLFSELYLKASEALRHGLERHIDKDELIREVQLGALALLQQEHGMPEPTARKLWMAFSEEYFLRHSPDEITWHTMNLAGWLSQSVPRVFLRRVTSRGGTAIGIYSTEDEFIFARATAILSELGLTVLDARLIPMSNGGRLDTYQVLEDNGDAILETDRLTEIEQALRREVNRCHAPPATVTRRAPRQVRMFTTPTEVQFADDRANHRTVLEITASDRPGLLSLIGQTLQHCKIHLQNAKITTVGERAEDVFFITDANNDPLDGAAARDALRSALLRRINEA